MQNASAILLTFIKLPFVIKIFVLSIFEWPFYTGFTAKLEMTLRKVRKRTKIRNRYNQAQHLTQNTNGKVTTSQLDITNQSQVITKWGPNKTTAVEATWE